MSAADVTRLIHEHADAPTLVALGGEPIVNVLELNVALDQMAAPSATSK
jgi:K+-transporting ATPase c subunit